MFKFLTELFLPKYTSEFKAGDKIFFSESGYKTINYGTVIATYPKRRCYIIEILVGDGKYKTRLAYEKELKHRG